MSLTVEVKHFDDPHVVTYNIPWSADLTIQKAMEQCYNTKTPPLFTFWVQYYGTFNKTFIGYMTVEINGRRRGGGYIWTVYLNNNLTNGGLDAQNLNPGDVVEFKYEPYSPSIHANTVYEKMMLAHIELKKQLTFK